MRDGDGLDKGAESGGGETRPDWEYFLEVDLIALAVTGFERNHGWLITRILAQTVRWRIEY